MMVRFSKWPWLAALIACMVIAGVAGFVVGGLGAPDVAHALAQGERAGQRAGAAAGEKAGTKEGKSEGWAAGFGPAKAKASKSVHARTLRAELKRAKAKQEQQAREAAATAAAAASQAAAGAYDSCLSTYGPDNFPPGNYTWSALVEYCKNISGYSGR